MPRKSANEWPPSTFLTQATGDATYAPIAKGVTNGDSHDHNGGDGAPIAYSGLSGLPTLGGAASLNVGTTTGTVAAGDHTHAQLHDRSHAITSTSDHTAGNWKVIYSNGSGQVVELALGANNTYLKSNGPSSAPTFETPTASVSISSTTVAFTDGDTTRRVTVTDGAVSASSRIILTVCRPDTSATADRGYLYLANVVTRATGTFDVLILALDESGGDCTELPPNETVTLFYQVA